MKGRLLFAFLLALAAPVQAQQLTFTTHIQSRKVGAPPPASPMVAAFYEKFGVTIAGNFLLSIPYGSADTTTTLGARELRYQAGTPSSTLPTGTIQIIYPDASALYVNSESKTYRRFPAPSAAAMTQLTERASSLQPLVSLKETGEFITIAGVRADHVTFDVKLNPAGLPKTMLAQGVNLELTGEAWLARRYRSYAVLQARSYPMSLLRQLEETGFPLRVILRGEILNGYEIERIVTSIAEGPESPFELPADYVEVQQGRPGIKMPEKIKDVLPVYSREAQRAGVEGTVLVEAVVGSDGLVRSARVVRSLDTKFGIDQEAVNAVRKWEFTPALLDGKAINVVITVNVAFHLRRNPPSSRP